MRMIFHIPIALDPNHLSGSHIRPQKMIAAFEEIGYQVDLVMGDQKTRKAQIRSIEKNLARGVSYDFCYGESSTMPTELTESHHLPTNFGMDFRFFKKLKERGVPIGVFYRDCYWLFDEYNETTSYWKRQFAKAFYKRELKKYKDYVDILYLPSKEMAQVLPVRFDKIRELPPGFSEVIETSWTTPPPLELFYVGGIGGLYSMEKVFQAVNNLDQVHLTICTRKNEWEQNKDKYEKYLQEKIRIIHGGIDVYRQYLERADAALLVMQPTKYREFAVPVKLYEYLQFQKPVIANAFPATKDFIENFGILVDYNEVAIRRVLQEILENAKILKNKKESAVHLAKENRWIDRAGKVVKELKKQ